MNIPGSYNPFATAYAKSQAGFRPLQRETPAVSFAGHLDKVTISKEARLKTLEPEPETPSLVKAYLDHVFGDPEELEKQTEEWKRKRMLGGPAAEDSQAKKDYTAFMDKLLGRGIIEGPKSLEERIKELTAKIKALQSRLSEVVTDESLPESTRNKQAEALTAQISALQAQIAKLAEGASEEMTAQGWVQS
jgi:polyhydroxyalkanoate synthesis regulator phasin